MAELALISDTHIPERATEIPDPFLDRITDADHVIHAGDFTSESVLGEVNSLADGKLTAVSGNMDPGTLGLPLVDTVTIEDVTFVVTHGTGDLAGYEARVSSAVRDEADSTAIGVAGHSHEVLDTIHDGVRILNPGSVTGASPADTATMMTATVEAGELTVTRHDG